MKHLSRTAAIAAIAVGMLVGSTTNGEAAPLVLNYDFGVVDLACASEGAACAQDILPGTATAVGNVFTNIFNGGYRAGGRVVWDFFFDDSPFASLGGMTMQVDVVGLWGNYPGNIGPGGQLGNFFAIDGVPIFPFLVNTDGRDSYIFGIPVLAPGAHQFSVQAYDPAFSPGGNFEGWGGVDFARLTARGESEGAAPVPEPSSLLLLMSGIAAVATGRRRRRYGIDAEPRRHVQARPPHERLR